MKNTKKIALCGIVAALSSVFMLTSYFPYLTYAIPAIAGIFMMVPLIECGAGWSFGTYIVSSLIVLITGEKESTVLFIALFGYYPILKAIIEKINKQAVEWALKLICFNIAAVFSYYVMSFLLSVSFDDFAVWGKYGAFIFLGLCNIVFVAYDIGISRVAAYYIAHLHGKIKRILK